MQIEVMARVGACYLHMHGGPLDGERWEVMRDDLTASLNYLVLPHPQEPGINVVYALRRTDAGPYYLYIGQGDHAD